MEVLCRCIGFHGYDEGQREDVTGRRAAPACAVPEASVPVASGCHIRGRWFVMLLTETIE